MRKLERSPPLVKGRAFDSLPYSFFFNPSEPVLLTVQDNTIFRFKSVPSGIEKCEVEKLRCAKRQACMSPIAFMFSSLMKSSGSGCNVTNGNLRMVLPETRAAYLRTYFRFSQKAFFHDLHKNCSRKIKL